MNVRGKHLRFRAPARSVWQDAFSDNPPWCAARLLYPVSMESGSVFAIIVNAAIFIGLWVIDIRPRHAKKRRRNAGPQREDEASSASSSAS